MFHTLYAKLAAVLFALFALVGTGAVMGTLHVLNLYALESSQTLNRVLARHLADQNLPQPGADADPERLRGMFDMQMLINPAIQIYLLDATGRMLAHAQGDAAEVAAGVALEPIHAFLSAPDARLPILGEDPREPGRRRIFSVAPIPEHGPAREYLYVMLANPVELGLRDALSGSSVVRFAFGIGVLSILMALAVGLVTFALMTRKLSALAEAVTRFQQNDFSERPVLPPLPAGRGDEIDRLGVALRDMSARLVLQVQKLRQTDVLRRELVANVSHDLKTPLATLQGYVDTLLLKEDLLTPDERRNYLGVASRSCTRLSKLVSDLIELAKLDAHEVTPHAETFSAAELLQDVLQKFQLSARQRGVELEVALPERAPYVSADIGLIERVLENLIGNALSHTDRGGRVRLSLETQEDHALLRVSDTGCGIPQEELNNVFERFYRVERPRWDRGGNAGLGLAISKSILDLHGSRMQVHSQVGEGTSFSFALPVSRLEAAA
jgi:two-component system, OmpR family, sensor kinase